MRQADLARATEFDPTVISKMVRGDYTFSDHHIEALAAALRTTPAQLMPGGPTPAESEVIEAIRVGDPGAALHALANALGMTGRQLVAQAGFQTGADTPKPLQGVGWAAAALVRQIAEHVAGNPQEAARLSHAWIRNSGPEDQGAFVTGAQAVSLGLADLTASRGSVDGSPNLPSVPDYLVRDALHWIRLLAGDRQSWDGNTEMVFREAVRARVKQQHIPDLKHTSHIPREVWERAQQELLDELARSKTAAAEVGNPPQ